MTSKAKTTQDPLFLTDGRDPPNQVIDITFLTISNALQYHPKVAGCYPLPRRNGAILTWGYSPRLHPEDSCLEIGNRLLIQGVVIQM